jgi:hypothetical protein
MGLLKFKQNQFSQNGEDGIIRRIFELIGTETKSCCEFGAWDGVHLSNTRQLLLEGWSGLLIESDSKRFHQLRANYASSPEVKCANQRINNAADLELALSSHGFVFPLDLLVVDIDGLDYYILKELRIRPRLICIEVNSGHSPRCSTLYPWETAEIVGQPLPAYCSVAQELGYKLIAFNANAFLLRSDVTHPSLPELDPVEAYTQFIAELDNSARRWMYLVNKGIVPPFFNFHNSYLSADALRLGPIERSTAIARSIVLRSWQRFHPSAHAE